MAAAGVGSRRGCEELIRQGRVRVNGAVAELGKVVDPVGDRIEVDGRTLKSTSRRVYLMLNKPRGYITTVSDPQGRPTVMELLGTRWPRVFPVGRLDRDTEGLLLLTNDGPLAHALLHPSKGVEKVYLARVQGMPKAKDLRRMEAGIELDDGPTAPCKARVVGPSQVEIRLKEGRKRQVRRMLGIMGYPVLELQRVRFGPLALGEMALGKVRSLDAREVRDLKRACS